MKTQEIGNNKSNRDAIRDRLEQRIIAIVSASKDHAKLLRSLAEDCLIYAIEFGDFKPINDLHKQVSAGDAETVRLFISNLCFTYGKVVVDESNGKEKRITPFDFKKEKGFFASKYENETWLKISKDSRKAILKAFEAREAGENNAIAETFEKVSFGPREKDPAARAERKMLDLQLFEEKIGNVLKAAAKEGIVPMARLEQVNKLLDTKLNLVALQPDRDKELAEAKAKVERLEALKKAEAENKMDETADNGENEKTTTA